MGRQSVMKKILARVRAHGRGWCFSQKDLQGVGSRRAIDVSLHRLVNDGSIRRIARGLYDYPEYSKILDRTVGPDPDRAAQAIARKHGWRIQPIGAIAANLLGTSEQVPAKIIYVTDGPSKVMKIGNYTIRFKHVEPKDINVKNPKSALVIQALKFEGKTRIGERFIRRVRSRLSASDLRKLLKDARYGTDWIYAAVEKICEDRERDDG